MTTIEALLEKYNINFVIDYDDEIKSDIINLFENNVISNKKKHTNGIYQFWLGVYYQSKKNYSYMKDFLHKAFSNDISEAYNILGGHCKNVEGDHKSAIYYYKNASRKNNVNAMLNISEYYKVTNKDELMISYYDKAISLGCSEAMYRMGKFYTYHYNDIASLEYYMMASEKNHTLSMLNVAEFHSRKANYEDAIKLFTMALKINDKNQYVIANSFSYYIRKIWKDDVKYYYYDKIYPYINILDISKRDKENITTKYINNFKKKLEIFCCPYVMSNVFISSYMLTF